MIVRNEKKVPVTMCARTVYRRARVWCVSTYSDYNYFFPNNKAPPVTNGNARPVIIEEESFISEDAREMAIIDSLVSDYEFKQVLGLTIPYSTIFPADP